jgi:hypothetical protein
MESTYCLLSEEESQTVLFITYDLQIQHSLECGSGGAALQKALGKQSLASIAECVATLVPGFTRLAGVSSPVLERAESGTRGFRAGLPTS